MEKLLLSSKAVPRWVILMLDLFINGSSFALSYFVVKHFEFAEILRGHFLIYTGIYIATVGCVFYAMRIHTCLIRYSNVTDMLRIFFSVLITSLLYPVIVELTISRNLNIRSLDLGAVLLINFFVASSLLVMLRTAIKEVFFLCEENVYETYKRECINFWFWNRSYFS